MFESGRENSPEAEAEAIINQSDESLEDLDNVAGTEIDEGNDAFEDEDLDDFDDDSESDDGGDFAD